MKKVLWGSSRAMSCSISSARSWPRFTVHPPGTSTCMEMKRRWPAERVRTAWARAPVPGPPAGRGEVQGEERALAGRAGADGVEAGARPLVAGEDFLDLGLVLGRQRPVQQTLPGVAQQPHPGPDDVGGDE